MARRESAGSTRPLAETEMFDPGESLRHYDETYLMCRDLRHKWEVVGYYEGGGYVHRKLACERCPTTRTDRLERNGHRRHPVYDYPDDYRIGGRVKPVDVLIETLHRVTIYGDEQQLMQSMFGPPSRRRT